MTGRQASIAARLKNAAIKKGVSFQYLTLLYMHEGLLRRLAASPYREHFALKGGLLLQCLTESGGRSTKDIDVLGNGIANDAGTIRSVFASIVRLDADDGLRFDDQAMTADAIVEGADYHGVRIRIPCYLGTIRNGVQVDVGFGDAVVPSPREMEYPILVDGSTFSLYAYPLSAVIAEKFQAMVALAEGNSRMKDFWDVAFILENFDVPADELRTAIGATFAQRKTPMPETLLVFSTDFAESGRSRTLWDSFIKRTQLPSKKWGEVLTIISNRLKPIYQDIRHA
ncbi:MAG TPA: nucleotidyl transferase AbiEii/AbiGii toxin family protein [Spirochaetia bacterium]|nr:nucleotidyl transferase AbiEii/AbiGii toxin family protein [Spirochaetia bacterium]